MTNNIDTTMVSVYRPDLVIRKSAMSDNNNDKTYDLLDSTVMTDAGKTIRYTLKYDNIGNTAAQDVVMSEAIPAQTCYVVGSLEQTKPAGTVVKYSNNQ